MRELLGTYLPLVLMLLLALGTWWLARNTPGADEPAPAAAPRAEPDYTMQHFVVGRVALQRQVTVVDGLFDDIRVAIDDQKRCPRRLELFRNGAADPSKATDNEMVREPLNFVLHLLLPVGLKGNCDLDE